MSIFSCNKPFWMCFGILLVAIIRESESLVKPTYSSLIKAQSGNNVTFDITYTDVTMPQVQWAKDSIFIATRTVGSDIPPPQIAPEYRDILTFWSNGSMSLINVSVDFSGTYDVTVAEVGKEPGRTNFTLIVYEIIEKVSLHTWPSVAVEGNGDFTLYYSTHRGEAEQVQWFFEGRELHNGSHHSITGKNLTISPAGRDDTGLYRVTIKNPFSSGSSERNVTVLYGPDQATLDVSPTKAFFVSGESLSLSCGAQGEPSPSVSWAFIGQPLPSPAPQPGVLHIPRALTNQSGAYTCTLTNDRTGSRLNKSVTVNIYESPAGGPVCSVYPVLGDAGLQYRCQWSGGTPEAQLYFPGLNGSHTGLGELEVTVDDLQGLDGRELSCFGHHPVLQRHCNITARRPAGFLPSVSSAVNGDGKLVASIRCLSEAVPNATVTWSRTGQNVSSLIGHEISSDTTWVHISSLNVSTAGLHTYTCTATNPLGSQTRDTYLSGPAISEASLFRNDEGTVITLTWEVPPTAIVTGFDIQMKGPGLLEPSVKNLPSPRKDYQIIKVQPADSRSVDIGGLDPKSRYYFRVLPRAGRIAGAPSEKMATGPGGGLSGPAIAGIAAGIPCSLLVLLLLCLIPPCAFYHRKKNRKARYPVSRPVEKAVTTISSPHNLLTGGLKMPPDYSVHQPPVVEHSWHLSPGVPPARLATTV